MFFFNDTANTEIYTLSLHGALPIFGAALQGGDGLGHGHRLLERLLPTVELEVVDDVDEQQRHRRFVRRATVEVLVLRGHVGIVDRKSTRLNSSHANISYAVFCLKKK